MPSDGRAEYGDGVDELLKDFARKYDGPGIPMPAARGGADYHCPDCEKDVRAITHGQGDVLNCPICGGTPGALVLGQGPKNRGVRN